MKKFIGITVVAVILMSLVITGVAFAADNDSGNTYGPGYCWRFWQNNEATPQAAPAIPGYGGYSCH